MADSVLKSNTYKYISTSEIMERWQVSRHTVVRVAREAGFTVFYPGTEKRSAVRFLREEVEAYEKSREIVLKN